MFERNVSRHTIYIIFYNNFIILKAFVNISLTNFE